MDSYKEEIGAYHCDRMLDIDMVPPIVERTIAGNNDAAVLWVENTKGSSVTHRPPGPEPTWSIQLMRMKMVDLLIANIDRNQGHLDGLMGRAFALLGNQAVMPCSPRSTKASAGRWRS